MIQTGRFADFVLQFLKITNEEKEEQTAWEFYLHKVWKGTFAEFKEEMRNDNNNLQMSDEDIETTIQKSMDILKNFRPNEGGEG